MRLFVRFPRLMVVILLLLIVSQTADWTGALAVGQTEKSSLSAIHGFADGTHTANQLDRARDVVPAAAVTVGGFSDGVAVSYLSGEVGQSKTRFVFDDLVLQSRARQLFDFPLLAYLDDSTVRSDALDAYQRELQQQKDELAEARQNVAARSASLVQLTGSLEQSIRETEERVSMALSDTEALSGEEALESLIRLREQLVRVTTQKNVLQAVGNRYDQMNTVYTNRLEFIAANRDPLLKGTRVVNLTDPEYRLILTAEEWRQGR